MPDQMPSSIPTRRIPGTTLSLSELTFAVDPPIVAPPSADDQMVAVLRRSRGRGVSTFDLASARSPARAERLLARAFPPPDPRVTVILGRSLESLAAEASVASSGELERDLTAALERSLDRSRSRLGSIPISVLEWDGAAGRGPTTPLEEVLPKVQKAAGKEIAVALRVPTGVPALPELRGEEWLFSGELSLLRTDPVRWFSEDSKRAARGFLARDPFAGGRLDGSRFSSTSALGLPSAGPVDVRQMHEEFDPVLRLGFLTEARRRTLAQAALQFVLAWTWVVTAIAPLPVPERWEELVAYPSRPPLTDEELARLGLVK